MRSKSMDHGLHHNGRRQRDHGYHGSWFMAQDHNAIPPITINTTNRIWGINHGSWLVAGGFFNRGPWPDQKLVLYIRPQFLEVIY